MLVRLRSRAAIVQIGGTDPNRTFSPGHDNGLLNRTIARRYDLIVCLFAAAIYLVACISPPALMDDVDAVQAQIARNMLDSGDWVTARLNGIPYLEKSPLVYWMMATSFA